MLRRETPEKTEVKEVAVEEAEAEVKEVVPEVALEAEEASEEVAEAEVAQDQKVENHNQLLRHAEVTIGLLS